ncbi:hypothetical protein [Flavobacterium gawalongense]|uniref:Uncharacterized protein n=1 Tax=Flavobacterium gawalongense TaxID=2594432 RepID=A0A553BMY1_9FLAO|nr:hypothetical protein [Flavobacterium gawalongense]TRW97021.1 hypothetical protein FNW33_16995 [Flavobacterium gawalongense]TRX01483.1 hypothetical protein FNW12_17020 [Flavobacterium gawalongense]TRX09620.1 hypothetical protein FNW11_08950 [Flavobacterium gawalongense]TRX10896.1 hypothetical protein FNW10_09070 [Flavobacterium gawalongense]TRX28025.1 hypothetical protein FNW38_08420 [Flavobacterium gawalongense]
MDVTNRFHLFLFFLCFSCSNSSSEKTFEFKGFDISKLDPIIETYIKNNWFGKAYEVNDTLRKIVFFDKKNTIIKEDSVFYNDYVKYLVSTSEIIHETNKLKLFKLTFLRKNKLQRHFLIQRFKMIYLICVDTQIKPNVFERRRINTNLHYLEFKDIREYLLNVKMTTNNKYYFSDYMSYEMFYSNGELFHNETQYYDWGNTKTPNALKFNTNYNNLYLDLDKIDDLAFIMDSNSYKNIIH